MTYNVIFRYLDAEKEQTARSAPVADFSECSAFVRAFILNQGIGASDWIAGEIYDGTALRARVAYNGRIME